MTSQSRRVSLHRTAVRNAPSSGPLQLSRPAPPHTVDGTQTPRPSMIRPIPIPPAASARRQGRPAHAAGPPPARSPASYPPGRGAHHWPSDWEPLQVALGGLVGPHPPPIPPHSPTRGGDASADLGCPSASPEFRRPETRSPERGPHPPGSGNGAGAARHSLPGRFDPVQRAVAFRSRRCRWSGIQALEPRPFCSFFFFFFFFFFLRRIMFFPPRPSHPDRCPPSPAPPPPTLPRTPRARASP